METDQIPLEIHSLAAEATSPHTDGFSRDEARKRLLKIKEYIERILEGC